MLYSSINCNFFGFAWTPNINTSYRRYYMMNKVYLCDLYLHPSLLMSHESSFSSTGGRTSGLHSSSLDTIGWDIDTNTTSQRPLCFYRSPINNRWKQRIDIQNLSIGQELQGVIVQEKLTNTTTGPKVWLDVGVCRWSSKGKPYIKDMLNTTTTPSLLSSSSGGWKICTALLRLGMSNYVKESAIRKKIARLRNKATITVYVSRIFHNEGRFDVVLLPEEVPSNMTLVDIHPPLQSVSQLNVGDEITGTVTKVVDYGAFIQLDGYNRGGLLHIRQVADLYSTYIDKKQGLIDSGLNPKSRVRLQVIEKNKRRILLDFTEDVKQIGIEEQRQEQEEIERQQNELRAQLQQQREKARGKDTMVESTSTNISLTLDSTCDTIENLDAPTQYNMSISVDDTNEDASREEEEDLDDEEEYDNYDEEREIEDALGLGMY